jgi:putative copper export protein
MTEPVVSRAVSPSSADPPRAQPHQFSAADLGPSDEERRAARRALADRVAAALATLAAGIWVGGMVALGACAAPFVFKLTPAPFSGEAMGAAFSRFDSIALGAAVVILGCEVVRTWAAGRRRTIASRIRRVVAIVMAASAAYIGLALTPQIMAMHRAGVSRNRGEQGVELERIHKRAEMFGKIEVVLGAALVGLHVFTLGARRPEDEDDEALVPSPPGPAAG